MWIRIIDYLENIYKIEDFSVQYPKLKEHYDEEKKGGDQGERSYSRYTWKSYDD